MSYSIASVETRNAFSEVFEIINHMEENLKLKIPNKFIELIKENRNLTYKPNIDFTKSINDQILLKETRIILSLIYRDYICDADKKKELLEKDAKEIQKYEEIIREKYDPEKVLQKRNEVNKNKKEASNISKQQEISVVKYKHSFFNKLINIIKTFFKRRK